MVFAIKVKKRQKLTTNLRYVFQPSNHIELQLQTQRFDVKNYSSYTHTKAQQTACKYL